MKNFNSELFPNYGNAPTIVSQTANIQMAHDHDLLQRQTGSANQEIHSSNSYSLWKIMGCLFTGQIKPE